MHYLTGGLVASGQEQAVKALGSQRRERGRAVIHRHHQAGNDRSQRRIHYDLVHHARDTSPADVTEARVIEQSVAGRVSWFHRRAGSVAQFVVGAGVVVAGSWLLVFVAAGLKQ